MSDAPVFDIDPEAFNDDPYPALAAMRAKAPIAYVPQLGSTLLTRRDDIYVCEKNVAVFSSHQPQGLMNTLMGHNLMRKDGAAHMRERKVIAPAVNPRTVREHWSAIFQRHADRILDAIQDGGSADLVAAFALPFSAECLKSITGLTNMRFQDMDAWSQAMIDGIANYAGNPEITARCHAATAGIDAAIDDMVPVLRAQPDHSLLSVMMAAEMPMESVRANIKLAISGGQNEPRDAVAGCIWALLRHPAQLEAARQGAVSWKQVFEEYARWISPIGMSPRRVDQAHRYGGVNFEPEDRVFLMFGAANRDEAHFSNPDAFDTSRDLSKSIPFGAGPHFCAGAWASREMIAGVALPTVFRRLPSLQLEPARPAVFSGWAFRGPLAVEARWSAP